MSRRDLTGIGIGPKINYDAYPFSRARLANLRDLAINDLQRDAVAVMADEFDREDQAGFEAGCAERVAQGAPTAFGADLHRGVTPKPDGEANGTPFGRRTTIERTKGER